MKFNHEGTDYLIEFERSTRPRPTHVQNARKMRDPIKMQVVTTARILKITGPEKADKEVVREYSVAHHYKDKLCHETGRKYALTLAMYDAPTKGGGKPVLGNTLTKEFRTKVWNAYHNRFETSK